MVPWFCFYFLPPSSSFPSFATLSSFLCQQTLHFPPSYPTPFFKHNLIKFLWSFHHMCNVLLQGMLTRLFIIECFFFGELGMGECILLLGKSGSKSVGSKASLWAVRGSSVLGFSCNLPHCLPAGICHFSPGSNFSTFSLEILFILFFSSP